MFAHRKATAFYLVVWIIGCLSVPMDVVADVIASSDLTLNNLRFSFSDPRAQVAWTDVWFGEVRAQAQDTDSGPPRGNSASMLRNDGAIAVSADTSHVHSTASFALANGSQPNVSVLANTHSQLEIIRRTAQADGFASSIFNNFFMLVNPNDPNATGAVQMTISLDYSGRLRGEADADGFFSIALRGLLRVDDLLGVTLGEELIRDLLNPPDFVPLHSGTNTVFDRPYTGSLNISIPLLYGTEYFLVALADSEVFGTNVVPEPGTLSLLALAGVLMLFLRRNSALPLAPLTRQHV